MVKVTCRVIGDIQFGIVIGYQALADCKSFRVIDKLNNLRQIIFQGDLPLNYEIQVGGLVFSTDELGIGHRTLGI